MRKDNENNSRLVAFFPALSPLLIIETLRHGLKQKKVIYIRIKEDWTGGMRRESNAATCCRAVFLAVPNCSVGWSLTFEVMWHKTDSVELGHCEGGNCLDTYTRPFVACKEHTCLSCSGVVVGSVLRYARRHTPAQGRQEVSAARLTAKNKSTSHKRVLIIKSGHGGSGLCWLAWKVI